MDYTFKNARKLHTMSDFKAVKWPAVLMIYEPWCGFSQRAAPIFDAHGRGLFAVNTQDYGARQALQAVVGVTPKYFPMIVYVERPGRYRVLQGPVTDKNMKTIHDFKARF